MRLNQQDSLPKIFMEKERTKLLIPAKTKIGTVKAVRDDAIDTYDVLYGGLAYSDKYKDALFKVKEELHEDVIRKFLESEQGSEYVIPSKTEIIKVFNECTSPEFIAEQKRKRLEEKKAIEKAKAEKERLEAERLEKERLEKERLEREKQERLERETKERIEREKQELERLQREQLEREIAKQNAIKQEQEAKEKELEELLEEKRIKKENVLNTTNAQAVDYAELNREIDEANIRRILQVISSETRQTIHDELVANLQTNNESKTSNVFDLQTGKLLIPLNESIDKLVSYSGLFKGLSFIIPLLCIIGSMLSYLLTQQLNIPALVGGLVGAIVVYIQLAVTSARLLNKAHIERNLEIMVLLEKDELGIPLKKAPKGQVKQKVKPKKETKGEK